MSVRPHCQQPGNCKAKTANRHCRKCAQMPSRGLSPEGRERAKQMACLYRDGYTLQQIGDQYGVTRERVRQIVSDRLGLSAKECGAAVRGQKKREAVRAKRNVRCLERWGCSIDQYEGLLRIGKQMRGQGRGWAQTPTGAFNSQRNNARFRGIPWELSLWEWWSIWQASGHWEERGRGQGYVMCRTGDRGAYAVGNVFIAPARHNNSKTKNKKSGLPIGVQNAPTKGHYKAKRMVNGEVHDLGTYSSPDLAHAAYLAAAP